MIGDFLLVYLDDIVVYSENATDHLRHMKLVLDRLREKKFFARRSKCEFALDTIKYLGHVITRGKVSVDPTKTEAIRSWPQPTCVRDV